jgi:hypothetical protein
MTGAAIMVSTEIQDLLNRLKLGQLEPSQTAELEHLSADEFVSDLSGSYPLVFQQRQVRDKHEIGMARGISIEAAVRQVPGSNFLRFGIFQALKNCVLISSYENSLSEITVLSDIRVRPKGGPSLDVVMRMGRGHKLDKTPDGWTVKPIKTRSVTLSESFLTARGWKFEVFRLLSSKKSI